jgi:iron complex outermembrane recepter protein
MRKTLTIILMAIFGFGFVFGDLLRVYAAEKEGDEFTLEEIIVTAEKREENLQKTSMAINAISGDAMENRAIADLKSALEGVAGVNLMTSGVGAQVFIRGYGSLTSPNVTDMSIGFLVDGVYSGRFQTTLSSTFDMERIEVLRGPQGTIYGRNAVAGQINLISKKPTNKFEAGGSLTLGNYDLRKIEATLNVPFSEKWAARAALLGNQRGPYITDGSDTENRESARIKLSYIPTEKLSFVFGLEYTYDRANPASTVPTPGSAGNMPALSPVAPDYGYDPGIYENGWVTTMGEDAWTQDSYHKTNTSKAIRKNYQLEINWDLGWGQLFVLPAISKDVDIKYAWMFEGEPAADFASRAHYELDQKTIESRLQNPSDSKIKWLVGLYGLSRMNYNYTGNVVTDPLGVSAGRGGGWVLQSEARPTKNYAFFGQGTYPVTDQFRVTGGLRFNRDIRKTDYRFANANITDVNDPYYDLAVNGSYLSGWFLDTNDQKSWTYKAGAEYDAGDASMLYAMITTGFKAGGMNLTALPLTPFKPEKMIAYSIGSKNRFMDQRLQLNAEAFYYSYKDYQAQGMVEGTDYFTGARTMFMRIVNATKGKSYGLDLETDYLINADSKVSATLEYLHTEYGDLEMSANPRVKNSTPYNLEGYPMAFSPKWSGTLAYEHNWGLDDGALLTARIDTKFSAGFWATNDIVIPGAWQDSYHRSNLNLIYLSPSGDYTANVWCKNLENMVLISQIMPPYRRVIAAPRTYGMTFSVKF